MVQKPERCLLCIILLHHSFATIFHDFGRLPSREQGGRCDHHCSEAALWPTRSSKNSASKSEGGALVSPTARDALKQPLDRHASRLAPADLKFSDGPDGSVRSNRFDSNRESPKSLVFGRLRRRHYRSIVGPIPASCASCDGRVRSGIVYEAAAASAIASVVTSGLNFTENHRFEIHCFLAIVAPPRLHAGGVVA